MRASINSESQKAATPVAVNSRANAPFVMPSVSKICTVPLRPRVYKGLTCSNSSLNRMLPRMEPMRKSKAPSRPDAEDPVEGVARRLEKPELRRADGQGRRVVQRFVRIRRSAFPARVEGAVERFRLLHVAGNEIRVRMRQKDALYRAAGIGNGFFVCRDVAARIDEKCFVPADEQMRKVRENRQVELDYLEARAFVDLDRNMRGGIVTMTCRLAVLDGAGGLQRQGET